MSDTDSNLIKLLLAASCPSSFNEGQQLISQSVTSEGDWQAFSILTIKTHLAPIIHQNLEVLDGVPKVVIEQLGNVRNQVLVRNMRLYAEFKMLLGVLEDLDAPVIPLKGIFASETYYQDPSLRHLSDIDILVKDADLERICSVMKSKSWSVKKIIPRSKLEAEKFTHAHPFTLIKDGVAIELHTHIHNQRSSAKISKDTLWEHSQPINFLGFSIHQFEKPMLLLHWCMHLYRHMVGRDIKLVSFVDISLLVRDMTDFELERFLELSREYACFDECLSILELSSKYFNAPLPTDWPKKASSHNLEPILIQFLNGSFFKLEGRLNNGLKRLDRIPEFRKKLAFIVAYIFPSKEFMKRNYGIANDSWMIAWYVYRAIEIPAKTTAAIVDRLR